MSNPPTGAYASAYPSDDGSSRTQQVAGEAKAAAGQAVADVKDTAAEQAQRVGQETRAQARNVVSDVRDRVGEQARTQNDKLVGSIRQTADHLDEMRAQHSDTPAAAVVSRVADGGRQLADYLDRNGPEGVLQEVQDFARRRPGAFLATALVAGFVVGRLGKGVAKADPDAGAGKPAGDTFTSTGAGYTPAPDYGAPGGFADPAYADPALNDPYPASTDYASTGTGTPVVVTEEYGLGDPERRP
ncbi:hypothetical protein [Actinoplanes sp. NPDC026619]|uniref:hypothetical protein n=1 Tax=Actinoplanes sp. NPDC026619 TaxID=3155798 RepID=UPI0033DD5AA9